MPDASPRRLLRSRSGLTRSQRAWERAELLEAQPAARLPALISDGGGLAFAPAALDAQPERLDGDDPAVAALAAELAARKRGGLEGWRVLARTEDEILYGAGRPPELVTATLRRHPKNGTWAFAGASTAEPLRAARDGIRASSWRVADADEADPDPAVLRIFVTEQAFASGQSAKGRILTPDLYVGDDELVLTIYVRPRPGFQMGARNPETALRVRLPVAVGERRLVDGALPLLPDGAAAER
jgi:hypothetical protein